MTSSHHDRILDQFTRQAVPFSNAAGIRDAEALQRIVQLAQAGPEDTVLDVGCGPGLLAAAFARQVRHVIGIDLTPAMLDRARQLQQEQRLSNISWQQGDVSNLPYGKGEFSIVSSRFVFHHLLEPLTVLKEMRRVCRPGGRIVVADTAPTVAKADVLNAMERLRDPSHVRALTLDEHCELFRRTGLPEPRVEMCRLAGELEDLLGRSFPREGDADRIRKIFADSIATDALDMQTTRAGGKILYAWQVAILVAAVP